MSTRVTVEDLTNGERESITIRDDYTLIVDGTCHVAHIAVYANGTHVITVKGRRDAPANDAEVVP